MGAIDEAYERLFICGYRAARRMIGDPDTAADIAQEAVARAFVRWRKIEDYTEPWVTRVAVNPAIDYLADETRASEASPSTRTARTSR